MADVKLIKVNSSGDLSQIGSGDTLGLDHGGTGGAYADAAAMRTGLDLQQQFPALDEIGNLTLTKGDIMVHNGSNVVQLDAGSNGQVIGYNSGTATGLEAITVITSPESYIGSCTNDNASTINKGEPVYFKSDGDVDLARANAETTCRSMGFVKDATITAAADGNVQLDGVITLGTTGAWDTIAGTTGGLTPGAVYYLSTVTAGRLTATVPTGAGNYICPVLLGLSSTSGRILERPRVLLA